LYKRIYVNKYHVIYSTYSELSVKIILTFLNSDLEPCLPFTNYTITNGGVSLNRISILENLQYLALHNVHINIFFHLWTLTIQSTQTDVTNKELNIF
ncbi:hypothetical protein Mgra_00004787, partial [Meloidogyne graminicola]